MYNIQRILVQGMKVCDRIKPEQICLKFRHLLVLFNISIISFHLTGLDKIEFLQSHENSEIYQRAFDIIEKYFGTEEEDKDIAPQVDKTSQQFQFNNTQNLPMDGFQF